MLKNWSQNSVTWKKLALWLFFLPRCAHLVVLVVVLTILEFIMYTKQEEAVNRIVCKLALVQGKRICGN